MEGGSTETYNWTGNLDYLQSEEVTLPSFFLMDQIIYLMSV